MDKASYNLKKKFVEQLGDGKVLTKAFRILETSDESFLSWDAIQRYKRVDPLNARLRGLLANTVDKKAWQLLWVPPSLPYYRSPEGPYENNNLKGFTKALVFSSWQVVPKVIAMICSYEAERNAMGIVDNLSAYQGMFKKRRPLVVFSVSEGELRGLRFFSLIYPCMTLAARIDPLKVACELASEGNVPPLEKVIASVKNQINDLLKPVMDLLGKNGLIQNAEGQRPDQSWYVAALALLDRYYCEKSVRSWRVHESDSADEMNWASMLESRQDEGESRFLEHVKKFWEYFELSLPLGAPPEDLVDILAKVAVASPAVVVLRSLLRLSPNERREANDDTLMASAASAAMGFRSLFNLPDSIIMIRGAGRSEDERYWEEVLNYCLDGNLQAVIDEYVHILRESLGQLDKSVTVAAPKIADEIATAVSLRTVSLDFDDIRIEEERVSFQTQTIRCRFALRYGDEKNVEDGEETRADQVRKAFNSPFRPFILASTSVGQEGLDFHQYCHSIYHWNLPANPVDLEQREGRIHRYKGHVIRRNLASGIPFNLIAERLQHLSDPWTELFDIAREARDKGQNDLVPYWIYETKEGVRIQRFVPCLPLSREQDHLLHLKQTLAVYRMVFGQPRQEDLVAYLRSRLERDISLEESLMYRIDLTPVQE
jgi:hypothetical protein